jgi:hypothetical protein
VIDSKHGIRGSSHGGAATRQGVALTSHFNTVRAMRKRIMKSFKFSLLSLRARLASAAFALVASFASLSAVFLSFALASGELEPALAKFKAEPKAGAVAQKAASKPGRS